MPLSFESAVALAMGLTDFERSTTSPGHSSFHLERMTLLADRLGGIHKGIPTVHVAGTKGKGSTSAMITSMLSAEGYRVGLFTSPHLHSVVERVRVGLDPISKAEFVDLIEQLWPAVEWVGAEGGHNGVTFFELMTAMAFQHYQNIKADFQVIEVGLGGRLDSTNIVDPAVSVITSISLDHVATLGDTIEQIAHEKAGIIKKGKPVIVAPQAEPDALYVFRQVARDADAPIVEVQNSFNWQKEESALSGQSFTLAGLGRSYSLWTLLLGDYQLENAATAVATANTLNDAGFSVSESSIVTGLKDVRWAGRLEAFEHKGRRVVVDGAHNPYSVTRLVKTLGEYVDLEGRVILVFAALGGHSAEGMLSALAPLEPAAIIVRSRHPRSADPTNAAETARKLGIEVAVTSDTVSGGFDQAIEMSEPGDLILCTGSLSVASEVLEELRDIEPEIYPNLRPSTDSTLTPI
jgi:dihydrofolate synthase/folylpolyglutamate synthase